MVLVHGATGDVDSFALIEGLLAERHSVWVYSRRGRGGSGDGPDYSIEREVEDVVAVLAEAGDHAHLVGHSIGATYCLLTAMQSPSFRSLVLYEPPLHLDRFDPMVTDDVQRALDAGDPDRALEILFPAVGAVEEKSNYSARCRPCGRGSARASASSPGRFGLRKTRSTI
jgi:pimeloyl-ACP methyl ester carboxylesterase